MSAVDESSLFAQIMTIKSTKRSLKQRVAMKHCQPEGMLTPLDALSNIMMNDILGVLHSMDYTLAYISSKILDESALQMKVDDWRHLHREFEIELRHFAASIKTFDDYTTSIKENMCAPCGFEQHQTGHLTSNEHILQRCRERITDVGKRTEKSNKSLMATMSLLESKRGIAEAESVTRLNELAFFFIPLTFSASVFSMQVKELGSSNVTLMSFFVLAIVIITCSYAFRLLVRSTLLRKLGRDCNHRIRTSAKLPSNAPIPTTSYVVWLWNTVWDRLGLPVFISIFTVILLAILWIHPLEKGVKDGATTVFSITGVAFVVMTLLMTGRIKTSKKWARRIAITI